MDVSVVDGYSTVGWMRVGEWEGERAGELRGEDEHVKGGFHDIAAKGTVRCDDDQMSGKKRTRALQGSHKRMRCPW